MALLSLPVAIVPSGGNVLPAAFISFPRTSYDALMVSSGMRCRPPAAAARARRGGAAMTSSGARCASSADGRRGLNDEMVSSGRSGGGTTAGRGASALISEWYVRWKLMYPMELATHTPKATTRSTESATRTGTAVMVMYF